MEPAHLRLVRNEGVSERVAPVPARPRLGDILRVRGLVSDQDIEAGLALHRGSDLRLGDALCATGALRREDLLDALEFQWGAAIVDMAVTPPDSRLIDRIGVSRCLSERAAPWRRIGATTVVATEDPASFNENRSLYEAALGPVMMALAGPGEVDAALARTHRTVLCERAETRVARMLSCRAWNTGRFRLIGASGGAVVLGFAMLAPALLLSALLMVATLSLLAVTGLKLAAAVAQTRVPGTRCNVISLHPEAPDDRLPVISVLVPLFREEHIASHLVRRLARLDYPRALLDLCLVVEEDDDVTRATLERTDLPGWIRVVTVPRGSVRTKPRALNYALEFCRGSLIGVYDAEDAPAVDQLRRVATHFAESDPQLACVQGCLDYYNPRRNWIARCFSLEYATWFRVVLPGISRLGLLVPLGGTTLFFRRTALDRLGGWDAHNVTEDADLGVRLARQGYRTEIMETVTEEEANCHAWPWVRQRSRWLKGYAMTYAVHMRHPRQLLAELGLWRFCGFQILFLGTLLQFTLAPLLWSMWLLPLGMPHPVTQVLSGPVLGAVIAVFIFSELVSLGTALRAAHRSGRRFLMPIALTLPLYFTLATAAMYKALIEMFDRPFYWDKTLHGHLGGAACLRPAD